MFSNLSTSSTKTAFIKIPSFIYKAGGTQFDNIQNVINLFTFNKRSIRN